MVRWIIVLLVTAALGGTAIADSVAFTVPAPRPGAPKVPELENYVFTADPYRSGRPPRGLKAKDVGTYLAVMIDKATPLRVVDYAEDAAMFYDASEVVAPFRKLLDKTEKTSDDVRRSIALARMVAALGSDADAAAAATYFVYLCGRAESQFELLELVELFMALPTTADPKPLADRLAARIAVLAPNVKTDPSVRLEYLKLTEAVTASFESAKFSKKEQASILTTMDRAARLKALIELYVGISSGGRDLLHWAAGRLRRETWAQAPAEFLVRVDKPAHTRTVITALRAMLPAYAQREPDEQTFMKLRTLRAIAYFGGALSGAEKKFLAANVNGQSDPLANEGFMVRRPKTR
jgi:hypothetical protein